MVWRDIIFGALQGITEWLPISSEGILVLFQLHILQLRADINALISVALILHLGTFLAALVYFHRDIWHLIKAVFTYKSQSTATQNTVQFLIISTLISGLVGGGMFYILSTISGQIIAGHALTFVIGILLLITAGLQLKTPQHQGTRMADHLVPVDGIVLGLMQGLAILPGISRSGITIASLLLRRYNNTLTLKLSFLMSLPVVFGSNIILQFAEFQSLFDHLIPIAAAFVFGLVTIHGLMTVSQRINFGWFTLIFGILTIIGSVFAL